MEHEILEQLVTKHDNDVERQERRQARIRERNNRRQNRRETRSQNKINFEQPKRERRAQLPTIRQSTDSTLRVFEKVGGAVFTDESIHTPLIVVEKSIVNKAGERSMIGVTTGINLGSNSVYATPEERFSSLLKVSEEYRLRSIKSMAIYVFRLAYDEEQPLGSPIESPEVSAGAELVAQPGFSIVRAMNYISGASRHWSTNRGHRLGFDPQSRALQQYSEIINIVDAATAQNV